MKKLFAKLYLSSLLQMGFITILAGPPATLVIFAFSYFLYPSSSLSFQDFEELLTHLKSAALIVPLTSLPFLIFFASPYVTALKYRNSRNITAWIFGLGGLILIYPFAMHGIKFLIAGVFQIHTVETAYFGIYVAMYAYHGVNTIAAILVCIVTYLLFLRTETPPD